MKHCFLLIIFLLGFSSLLCPLAEDIEMNVSVSPERIGIEDRLKLTVTYKGVGNPPEPDLSALGDFEVVPGVAQRGTEFIMSNSGSTLLTRLIYQLRPKRKGKLTISPLSVTIDGRVYRSRAVTVQVVEGKVAASSQPALQSLPDFFDDPLEKMFREQNAREPDLFVRASPSKKVLYSGEAMLLRIELSTRDQVDEKRMLRAASVPGFWVEWVDPHNVSRNRQEEQDGKMYTVLEIDRGIFIPQRSGSIKLPPFEYAFLAVPGSGRSSFFSQRRQVIRSTEAISVEVLPLPREAEGLAVGRFQITLSAKPDKLDLSDLLTLYLVIRGEGNVRSVELPELPLIEGFKPFPAKIERKNHHQDGVLNCELSAEIPVALSRVGRFEIPPLRFRFFNPQTARIELSQSESLQITVSGNVDNNAALRREVLDPVKRTGADIDYIADGSIDDPRKSWIMNPVFYLMMGLSFLLPLFLLFHRYLFCPLRAVLFQGGKLSGLQVRLKQIKRVSRTEDLLPLLDGFLAEALSIRPSELTRGALEQELGRIKLTGQTADRLLDVRDALLAFRFAGGKGTEKELNRMKDDTLTVLSAVIRGVK